MDLPYMIDSDDADSLNMSTVSTTSTTKIHEEEIRWLPPGTAMEAKLVWVFATSARPRAPSSFSRPRRGLFPLHNDVLTIC